MAEPILKISPWETVNLPASPQLDDLYGPVRHTVISNVNELPDKLLRLYGTLTRA